MFLITCTGTGFSSATPPGAVDDDDLAVAAVVIGCYLHLMDYRGEVVTDASYALERPQITDKRLLSRFDPEFAPSIAP
ncbi:hypothetical protein [Pseudoscardovia suis]|nr:hypothetical protein [Pseudoscardovia suis]